jgi:hypothetical protein
VWIVSPEDQALQAFSVPKNILGNMFPLRGEKAGESVDRLDNPAVDVGIPSDVDQRSEVMSIGVPI